MLPSLRYAFPIPSPKRQRGGPEIERGTKTNVRSRNDRDLKMSRLFGSQEAIVVPLADQSFCIKGWKVFLTEELSRTINDV